MPQRYLVKARVFYSLGRSGGWSPDRADRKRLPVKAVQRASMDSFGMPRRSARDAISMPRRPRRPNSSSMYVSASMDEGPAIGTPAQRGEGRPDLRRRRRLHKPHYVRRVLVVEPLRPTACGTIACSLCALATKRAAGPATSASTERPSSGSRAEESSPSSGRPAPLRGRPLGALHACREPRVVRRGDRRRTRLPRGR